MSQNTTHAVMAQRHEAHDSLDYFPTPPWATRALCEHVIRIQARVVCDPACGEGAMVTAFEDYDPLAILAADVHDYGKGFKVADYLFPTNGAACDWMITNPPFRLAEEFIHRGLELAECGVAVLVRSVFMESVGRYASLFSKTPPAIVAQFTERVPMVKGRLDKHASSATSYAWFIWAQGHTEPTRLVWIPPCRKRLEKASDYV